MPFAGGLMQNGYQCGMLWGAALAAGGQAYRLYGPGRQAEAQALRASQRLVEVFQKRNKHVDCGDIIQMKWKSSEGRRFMLQVLKFFLRGGPVGCFSMAARFAPVAFKEINATFSEIQAEAPAAPVSCAALVAQKLGASEMHTTMAAGLAGGIGLSGSACGALGTAIWLIGIEAGKAGVEKIEYAPQAGAEAIDRFLKAADYEFECEKIAGRKFENVEEHARYLAEGGCAKVIESLIR